MGQIILNGLLNGAVYALIGVGLTLIFGVMRVIDFAHGDFLMIAMYAVFFIAGSWHLGPYGAGLLVVPIMFAFGAVVYLLAIHPVLRGPELNQLLITVGIALVLQNAALMVFSPSGHALGGGSETAHVFGLTVGLAQGFAAVASALSAFVLHVFLQRTTIGRTIRAASEDREAAQLCGVDIRLVFSATFGLGIACVAVSAALLSPFFFVSPSIGVTFTLLSFLVVVLGGLGSFPGALAAGLLVGVVEALGSYWLPGSYAQVLLYGVFIAFLVLRPQGLFGESRL